MSLSREEARRVALLARLELTDEELDAQARHINDLMREFEQLQQLDVTGIDPTSHSIPLFNVLRNDVVCPGLPRDALLANAPEARDGYFVVPRIV